MRCRSVRFHSKQWLPWEYFNCSPCIHRRLFSWKLSLPGTPILSLAFSIRGSWWLNRNDRISWNFAYKIKKFLFLFWMQVTIIGRPQMNSMENTCYLIFSTLYSQTAWSLYLARIKSALGCLNRYPWRCKPFAETRQIPSCHRGTINQIGWRYPKMGKSGCDWTLGGPLGWTCCSKSFELLLSN